MSDSFLLTKGVVVGVRAVVWLGCTCVLTSVEGEAAGDVVSTSSWLGSGGERGEWEEGGRFLPVITVNIRGVGIVVAGTCTVELPLEAEEAEEET